MNGKLLALVLPLVMLLVGAPRRLPAQSTIPTNNAVQAPGTTLKDLVAELERGNPELGAARREIDMRVARIAPAGALPDPTISAGFMSGLLRSPFFPSTNPSDSFRQFGVSQEFPYPGKLSLKTKIATTEADAERWNFESTRRRLVSDLKSAYFEYVYVDRSLTVLARNKERLEQFRQIAEARFSVGKTIQQDVLKAQLEVSLLLEGRLSLEQK